MVPKSDAEETPVAVVTVDPSSEAARQLYVGNIPRTTNNDELQKVFEEHGVVEKVEVDSIWTYELLNVLEFNSASKRMSVIGHEEFGNHLLLCKGADRNQFEENAKEHVNEKICHPNFKARESLEQPSEIPHTRFTASFRALVILVVSVILVCMLVVECRQGPYLISVGCGRGPYLIAVECGRSPYLLEAECGWGPYLLECRQGPYLLEAECGWGPYLLECGRSPYLLVA
uniref:RRM domain-containing protein n=1 Tax=Lactuca sativa TaxID=4236 RepID=A0A9R1WCM7_LACSA|nr:hypothetical protein LSAT_V11C200051690 [Lactuca sativa]